MCVFSYNSIRSFGVTKGAYREAMGMDGKF